MPLTETPTKKEARVAPCQCFHEETALVFRMTNKQKEYLFQCSLCGAEMAGRPDATSVQERLKSVPFDWALRSSGISLDYRARQEEKDEEWQARYQKHLVSAEWQELRKRVLFRCQGICEGCRKNPAVQVHHLTYKRLGREMLFDLVGVCRECHQGIHPDKDLI